MPQPQTQRRWSEDTRIAFLLALRLTGGVRLAAAEIERHVTGCYKVRERDPDFARRWDAIVADQAAQRRVARFQADSVGRAGAGPPMEYDAAGQRVRRDGLTQLKRRAFLRALTESGSAERACARAGVSDPAVYRLRRTDADFAAAWDRALATAQPLLEQVVWERAVEGWEEPLYRNGVQVGTRRRFSETLLRQLVVSREKALTAGTADPAELERRAHDAARAAGGFFGTRAAEAETDAAILKALDLIDQREEREEFEAAEAAGLWGGPWRSPTPAAAVA